MIPGVSKPKKNVIEETELKTVPIYILSYPNSSEGSSSKGPGSQTVAHSADDIKSIVNAIMMSRNMINNSRKSGASNTASLRLSAAHPVEELLNKSLTPSTTPQDSLTKIQAQQASLTKLPKGSQHSPAQSKSE